MPTCDGPDDIVALVDSIDASPEVLVDFNNSPLFYSDWSAPPPPNDGPIYLATSHEGRVLTFNVNVEKQATAAEVSAALQPALRYISRGEVWLMFQKSGGDPVFFKLRRSSVTALQEFFEITDGSAKTISLSLNADPFAEGLAVTGSATITNDPSSGANPMQHVMPDIQGDVLAPLYLSFPTADLLHKVKWASEAIFADPAPILLLDDFNRPDSTSSVGNPIIGPSPTVRDGTAGIDEHAVYFSAGGTATSSVVWDVGTADGTFEVEWSSTVGGNNSGIYVRSSSDENGYFFGETTAFRNTAGSYASLGAYDGSVVFTDGDVLRVVMNGTSILVYRQAEGEGEFVLAKTITDSTFNTVTNHGVARFAGSPRWGGVKFIALSATAARTSPYFKNLASFTKDATPATGWTITDTADTGTIGGTRRRLVKSGGDSFIVPTSAAVLPWADLPPGDYRVFVRVASIDVDTKVMFFNRPPRSGSVLTEDDAVTWTVAGPTPAATGHRDWLDLGVAALPGGSPIPDIMYGLDPIPDAALWNVAVSTDAASTVLDLDAIMVVPAGRPGTITRHGGATFTDDYTAKTAIIDGINSRRYATGITSADPTSTVTALPALEMYGALPIVVPNCQNILTFLADTIYYDAARVNDDKTLTTLIEWAYHPRYYNDRPDAT